MRPLLLLLAGLAGLTALLLFWPEPASRMIDDSTPVAAREPTAKQTGTVEQRDRTSVAASRESANPETLPKSIKRVRGTVVDATTRNPIAGATLTDADVEIRPVVLSAVDGSFDAPCWIDEIYGRLRCTHDDYLPWITAIEDSMVGPDGVSGLTIELWPLASACTLECHIKDPHGKPRPDARLELTRHAQYVNESPKRSDYDGVADVDDDTGRYRVRVVPGDYRLQITCDGFSTHTRASVAAPPGGQVRLGTITLTPQLVATLRGRVLENGQPRADVELSLRAESGAEFDTESDANGGYEFTDLPPGNHAITAELWNPDQKKGLSFISNHRRVWVAANRTTQHDIHVSTGTAFVGGVVLVAGRPAQRHLSVQCYPPTALAGTHTTWTALTGSGGRFHIEKLPGGPVSISVSTEAPYEVAEFDKIQVGRDDHRFEIKGALPRVRLSGVVRDVAGQPIGGAVVRTWQPSELREIARTDAEGRYALPVQFERDSGVLVTAHRSGFVVSNRTLRQAMYKKTGVTVDFTLVPIEATGEVTGRVTDQHGDAVVDALVMIVARRGEERAISRPRTDSNGAFFKRGVLAGDLRLVVRHASYETANVTSKLEKGQRLTLDVKVRAHSRSTHRVEVWGDDNTLAQNARVNVIKHTGEWIKGAVTKNGSCEFKGLPDLPLRIICSMKGYPNQEIRHDFSKPSSGPLQIRMRRGTGSVRGTVTDAAGKPRAKAEVIVEETATKTGRIEAVAYTDDTGKFVVRNLPAGSYRITSYPELPKPVTIDVGAGEKVVALRLR